MIITLLDCFSFDPEDTVTPEGGGFGFTAPLFSLADVDLLYFTGEGDVSTFISDFKF